MSFFATSKDNPRPFLIWFSAALVGIYGLYLFVISWVAKGNADLLQIILLIITLWLVLMILKGMPTAQTFLLSRAILLAGWVILSLCLMDFESVGSTLSWVNIISFIFLPITDIIAFVLLFTPAAARFIAKTAAAKGRQR